MSSNSEEFAFPSEIESHTPFNWDDVSYDSDSSLEDEENPDGREDSSSEDLEGDNSDEGVSTLYGDQVNPSTAPSSSDGDLAPPTPYENIQNAIIRFRFLVDEVQAERISVEDIPRGLRSITTAIRDVLQNSTFTAEELTALTHAYFVELARLHIHFVCVGLWPRSN